MRYPRPTPGATAPVSNVSDSPAPDDVLRKVHAALCSGNGLDELDDDTLDELLAHISNERRARAQHRRTPSTPRRVVALDTLGLLGVPAPLKTLSAVALARSGTPLDGQALASTRRDERRAWFRERAGGATPVPRLAPALHHENVEPVRSLLTVSTWDLGRRVVTPHSARADRPAMVLALLDEADRLAGIDSHAASRLRLLACDMAAGIPGTSLRSTDSKDRATVRRAAVRELSRFATIAIDEQRAAAQAMLTYSDGARIWGRAAAARGTR